MKQNCGTNELRLAGFDVHVFIWQRYQLSLLSIGQRSESVHQVAERQARPAEKFFCNLFPSLSSLRSKQHVESRIKTDFFSFPIKTYRHVTTRAGLEFQTYRPEQNRADARQRLRCGANQQERKTHVKTVNAGVAFIRICVCVKRSQSPFKRLVFGKDSGIKLQLFVATYQQLFE